MTMHGYTYDTVPDSPVTTADLALLQETVLFTDDDRAALRKAADILEPQVEDVLDVWYGFVGSNPHLLAYFSTQEGEPLREYLDAVRKRFGQWILDTCRRPYDERWLAYQEEMALRHTHPGKNTTDYPPSVPHIPLRYVSGLIYPITATLRPFLESSGEPAESVEAMHQAWFKSIVLQISLWARPYAASRW